MKITCNDNSTMHSIIQRAERARTAFVGIALKVDEGITKLVTRNTDVHKFEADYRLNGERFIAATAANNEKIVIDTIPRSR